MCHLAIVVLLVGDLDILQSFGSAIFRHQLFDVMCGAVLGDHQQVIFIGLIGDASHRTNLRVAQGAVGKSFADFRQLSQRMCHTNLFPGRVHADTTLEIQPMGAGAQAQLCPILLLVEFADQA